MEERRKAVPTSDWPICKSYATWYSAYAKNKQWNFAVVQKWQREKLEIVTNERKRLQRAYDKRVEQEMERLRKSGRAQRDGDGDVNMDDDDRAAIREHYEDETISAFIRSQRDRQIFEEFKRDYGM